MSLDPNSGANGSQSIVDQQIVDWENFDPILSPEQVAEQFAQVYLDYSTSGECPGADLSSGGDKSILDTGLITDNTTQGIQRFAQGICDYWSSIDTPGAPAHGGTSVVSVVVDGDAVLGDMVTAITNVITDQPAGGWLDFYTATQSIVNTIPCTITELMPPSNTPQDFMETIS